MLRLRAVRVRMLTERSTSVVRVCVLPLDPVCLTEKVKVSVSVHIRMRFMMSLDR